MPGTATENSIAQSHSDVSDRADDDILQSDIEDEMSNQAQLELTPQQRDISVQYLANERAAQQEYENEWAAEDRSEDDTPEPVGGLFGGHAATTFNGISIRT